MLKCIILCGLCSLFFISSCQPNKVQVREGTFTVKTNEELIPNDIPQFANMGTRAVYPYPLVTNIDYALKPKKLKALFVENEFLKVVVLPELGGHIYSATDKLTGGQIFWDNPELKKALIGLAGAWCAFGVEINFPMRGHIPTTVSPVNYALQNLPNGGRAIVISDREYMANMKWTVKIILRPQSPRLEIAAHLYNCTGSTYPLYYWLNAAVRANENVQVVFPQPKSSTHGSPWIREWPQERGKDLSWYKNHAGYTYSRFNRDDLENFMGYYDYGEDFGAFHYADRNELPYRKFWSWGLAKLGRFWNKRLSDTYGDYVELQAGLFKDQETVSFIGPHNSVNVSHYWVPVRKCGGLQYASLDAALCLKVDSAGNGHRVVFGANTYRDFNSPGLLKLYAGDSLLCTKQVNLNPAIFHKFYCSGKKAKGKYRLALLDAQDSLILSFTQACYRQSDNHPIGSIAYPEAPSSDKMAAEDFFMDAKMHESRFRLVQALESYQAGIKKYPHSFLLNKGVARLLIKNGEASAAIDHLKRACHRHVKDTEIDYLLGLAFLQTGNLEYAETYFKWALRAMQHAGACHYHLGLIQAQRHKWEESLFHFEEALSKNPDDLLALQMAAWATKRTGHALQAFVLAEKALRKDPTCFLANHILPEKHMLKSRTATILRNEYKQWQYVVEDFVSLGEYRQAFHLLLGAQGFQDNPMYHYTLAWLAYKLNIACQDHLFAGSKCNVARIFPHTLLDKKVLQFGASHNREDANSLHLLGLYYISKGNYISGAAALEKAVEKKQASAHSHFALAMVYPKLKKGPKEIVAHLERALQKSPDMQYAAIRLASMQKRLKVPVQKRLDMLLKTKQAVKEKAIEALDKAIILCHMEKEDYEKAAQAMKSREFHTWEGRHGMRPYWWNNQLLWARKLFQEKKFDQALDKIHTSVVFPENLFAEEADYGLEAFETFYLKGKVLKSMGKIKAARVAFEKSASWAPPGRGNQYFFSRYHKLYAALSFRELGNKKAAGRIISRFNKRYKDRRLWGLSEILFLDILKQKRKAYQKARSLMLHEDQSIKTLLVDKYLKGELVPFK